MLLKIEFSMLRWNEGRWASCALNDGSSHYHYNCDELRRVEVTYGRVLNYFDLKIPQMLNSRGFMIESIKCEIVKAMQGIAKGRKRWRRTDGSKMCERRFDLKHLAVEFFSLIFYFHKITIDSFCFCFCFPRL